MLGFFKAFAGTKGKEVAQQFTQALVAMDPKAASAAQLQVMEHDLDTAGALLVQTRQDHQREVTDYETAQRRFQEGLAGAEVLKRKVADATTDESRKQFQDALARLLGHLEEQKADLDREKDDVEQAAALLHEVDSAYREKAEHLASAKRDLERAQRDMSRSEIEASRARDRAEASAKIAGLRDNEPGSLTTAIDAMRGRAAANRAVAAAATEKASVLKKGANGDDVIAAAIAEGQPVPTTKSTEDRLAALKQ